MNLPKTNKLVLTKSGDMVTVTHANQNGASTHLCRVIRSTPVFNRMAFGAALKVELRVVESADLDEGVTLFIYKAFTGPAIMDITAPGEAFDERNFYEVLVTPVP